MAAVGTVRRMLRRDVLAVLADCEFDRLEMAGAPERPMFLPSTMLRFASGARIQLDGVPPDQLAALKGMVASGAVSLKAVSARQLWFEGPSGECSCAAQMMSVAWDPWAVAK